MSDRLPASQLAARPRPDLREPPATASVAPGLRPAERFAGPTIAEDFVMLLDLYRDLLGLAVWRQFGARASREKRTRSIQRRRSVGVIKRSSERRSGK